MPPRKPVKLIDFYKVIPKKYLGSSLKNPHLETHHLEFPLSILCIGPMGSGKTNFLLGLMHIANNTFQRIILCTNLPIEDDPLYMWLRDKLGDSLELHEGYDKIPDLMEEEPDDESKLIIFDDLVNQKKPTKIENFFRQGRRRFYTSIYLTQSYFKTPLFFRENAKVIILKKINTKKDLRRIVSEYALGLTVDELEELYLEATEDPLGFLMIITSGANKGIYKNFERVF